MKYLTILLIIYAYVAQSLAQSNAPVKWSKYKVADAKLAILLPKLPVRYDLSNSCSQIESSEYWVYADDTVYGFRVVSKSKQKPPDWCREKRRFGRLTMDERLRELRNGSSETSKFKSENFGRLVHKFKSKGSNHWLFEDLKNDRWMELSIFGRSNATLENNDFLSSLTENIKGDEKVIGEGSDTTLGDGSSPETTSQTVNLKPESDSKDIIIEPFTLVAKTKARYTDTARQANVQGTVTLRVVFLANGGVGAINIITSLPHGLTEQAIVAAKKMVFLPKKVKGIPVALARPVSYTFNIY